MKRILACIAALMLAGAPDSLSEGRDSFYMAPETVRLDGHTHITVAGKEETRDGMVLEVALEKQTASVGMYDFQILTFKGLSFEGDLSVDSDGIIRGFSNVRIKGFSPIKVISITGKVTGEEADILVRGKAAMVFNFTIKYWSGK